MSEIPNDVNAGRAAATLESEKKLASVVEQVNTLIEEQLKSLKRINDEYTKQLSLLENQKKLDNDIFMRSSKRPFVNILNSPVSSTWFCMTFNKDVFLSP